MGILTEACAETSTPRIGHYKSLCMSDLPMHQVAALSVLGRTSVWEQDNCHAHPQHTEVNPALSDQTPMHLVPETSTPRIGHYKSLCMSDLPMHQVAALSVLGRTSVWEQDNCHAHPQHTEMNPALSDQTPMHLVPEADQTILQQGMARRSKPPPGRRPRAGCHDGAPR